MSGTPSTVPPVSIIMGTYNGEKFIREQIASIQQQDVIEWQLLVRDDGSKDATVAIIRELAQQDARIRLISDNLGNLGFNDNFYHLLSQAPSPYIMFCDQDDIWLPAKISRTLDVMRNTEYSQPDNTPILVHSDASIVDRQLNPIKRHFIGARGNIKGINAIVMAPCVQGAASMINAALKNLTLSRRHPIPYDYQCSIIAATCGVRVFINEPLLYYRQHEHNAIGAMRTGHTTRSDQRSDWLFKQFPALSNLVKYFETNKAILEQYIVTQTGNKLLQSQYQDYLYIFEGKNCWKKILVGLKNRYGFSGRKDRVGFIYALLTNRFVCSTKHSQ